MNRRQVIGLTAGAIAVAPLAGLAARLEPVLSSTTGIRPFAGSEAAAFRAARRYLPTPAGKIAYVERGRGDAALFLHGFPLNGFQWRGALDRLSAHRRCIAPDFLGLGSTEVDGRQSVAPGAQVEMLVSFLDGLSLPRVDLVANDSGGAIAQLLLARHPERIRSLLLTNCDTEIDCPPPALLPVIELSRRGKYVEEWLAPWLADKALARSPEGLGGLTYTHPSNPTDEAIEIYLEPLVRSADRTHAYALALEGNALSGIEPALRRSSAPARIIWGAGDTIFSPEAPDYLDRTLGNSRGVRRIEGAKLFFPEEYPDLIAEEARRLWRIP